MSSVLCAVIFIDIPIKCDLIDEFIRELLL